MAAWAAMVIWRVELALAVRAEEGAAAATSRVSSPLQGLAVEGGAATRELCLEEDKERLAAAGKGPEEEGGGLAACFSSEGAPMTWKPAALTAAAWAAAA